MPPLQPSKYTTHTRNKSRLRQVEGGGGQRAKGGEAERLPQAQVAPAEGRALVEVAAGDGGAQHARHQKAAPQLAEQQAHARSQEGGGHQEHAYGRGGGRGRRSDREGEGGGGLRAGRGGGA